MRNTLKATTLESKFPLLAVEEGCILSKDADITVAFEVELPELYTVTSAEYEAIHAAWCKAIRVLPDFSIVHKQDWFVREQYRPELQKEEMSFLNRSFERHFNERPYLDHTCYLFLTKTTKERSRRQSNWNTLCRGHIIPKEIRDKDAAAKFIEATEQFERIMNDSGFIRLRRLTSDEITGTATEAGLVEKYFSLSPENTTCLQDIALSADEMRVGDKNDTFPKGGSTGLGSGYDNHMNQYTWQTTVHEGKMYLSTMNTTTLLEPIAQFTNGDILNMNEKDWNNTVHYLRVFLRLLWGMGPTDPASAIATQSNDQNAKVTTQTMPSTDNPEALVDWARIQAGKDASAAQPQTTDAKSVSSAKPISLTAAQTKELVDGIKDGSIVPGSLAASGSSDEASQLFDINNELDNLGSQLSDKGSADFANNYGEVTDAFFSIADIIPDKFKGLYEMLVKLTSKANLKAYAKSLPYLAKSKRGFNLFEITDRSAANEGVTVGTVTDNGFGDPFNHGLRIFCDTDDYMVVGTANPFYGTQLWRVRNTQYAVNVSATEGGSASADVERAAKGSKVTLTATANKGYHFKEWNVLKGNVSIENNAFEMPDGSVSIQAVFEKDAVEPTTPTTPAKPATDTKPSTTPTGVTSSPSTGSSVLGMAVAAAVALIAGAAILLKKKQA